MAQESPLKKAALQHQTQTLAFFDVRKCKTETLRLPYFQLQSLQFVDKLTMTKLECN